MPEEHAGRWRCLHRTPPDPAYLDVLDGDCIVMERANRRRRIPGTVLRPGDAGVSPSSDSYGIGTQAIAG
ncbi:MAG: hypothetical protein AAFV53_09635 [Myxococcota bacterium]